MQEIPVESDPNEQIILEKRFLWVEKCFGQAVRNRCQTILAHNPNKNFYELLDEIDEEYQQENPVEGRLDDVEIGGHGICHEA